MEKIEKEQLIKTTYYKAWDGTVFNREESCIKYESKPSVVAWKNVQSFLVRKFRQHRLSFDYSENETPAFVFKPTCHEDIDALNNFIRIDRWEHVRNINLLDDSYIGKEIFVFGDNSWNALSLDEMVNEFRNRLKDIIDDEEADMDYDDDNDRVIRNR